MLNARIYSLISSFGREQVFLQAAFRTTVKEGSPALSSLVSPVQGFAGLLSFETAGLLELPAHIRRPIARDTSAG